MLSRRYTTRAVLTAALTLLFALPAESAPVVLTGTTWSISGIARLAVRRAGRDRDLTSADVSFPSDGTFMATDDEEHDFSGTYSTRGRRRNRLVVSYDAETRSTVEDFLAEWIEEELADDGIITDVDVSITRHRVGGVVNRRGTRLAIRGVTRFRATALDLGVTRRGVYRVRLAGAQSSGN